MTNNGKENLMEKIVSLCKRRGFIFPGSEIYGGLANSWDYGPLGVELKNNIKQDWWKRFVLNREDIVGIDTAVILNPKVWQASGHVDTFNEPLIECKKCHQRFREDALEQKICPNCKGKNFTEAKSFNNLFRTFIGPVEDSSSLAYLRGETAQGIFVNFANILNTERKTLPFGIAQIGKAFRNEITPGNFIFRTREFEQMEIEYFIPEPEKDDDWQKWFTVWQREIHSWLDYIGINSGKISDFEVPEKDRAHYSKKTVDFEYEFPFGKKELLGLAYRADFDLKNHEKFSCQNLKYRDSESQKEFWPHVIEPSFGIDRLLLAILLDAYVQDGERTVLKLKPWLAPYKAAVFPLLANKPELVEKARKVFESLRQNFHVAWDERGNIGKRYYSQDEIGT
ncbi:MAG: glycine--tRNA ligase, partial [bacterium]|nr:glycine--tRNA ligase [bacterium]